MTRWGWVGLLGLVGTGAFAAESKCTGNRVERGGSTQYTVRRSGEEMRIERLGATRGRAVRHAQEHVITVDGQTLATLRDGHIYRDGARWASVGEAQRVYDCPDLIAATLWVLDRAGR
jgi:hypothetical protein